MDVSRLKAVVQRYYRLSTAKSRFVTSLDYFSGIGNKFSLINQSLIEFADEC